MYKNIWGKNVPIAPVVFFIMYLEAGLAAGDNVELVVSQLQRPVDSNRDGDTPLLRFLKARWKLDFGGVRGYRIFFKLLKIVII